VFGVERLVETQFSENSITRDLEKETIKIKKIKYV